MTEVREGLQVIKVRPSDVYAAQLLLEFDRAHGLASTPGTLKLAAAGPRYLASRPGALFRPTRSERLRSFVRRLSRRNRMAS